MNRSSDVLKAQIANAPIVLRRDDALRVTRSYFSSYDLGRPEQRIRLFAERFIFEDPAGVPRASDKHTLRTFFAKLAAGGFQLRFEEKRIIVVGNSCLVAALAHVTVGDSRPAMLELFIVFRINEDGLIEEFRTYFDQYCVHDAFD
jgi:limonene-1,2-epoxide hydrolase